MGSLYFASSNGCKSTIVGKTMFKQTMFKSGAGGVSKRLMIFLSNSDCWCFEREVLECWYFCFLIWLRNTYLKNSSSSLLMMNLLAFLSVIAIVSSFGFLFGSQSWSCHSRLRGWSQLCSWLSGGSHRASVCTSNSTYDRM